jgi:hypothetical protein
MTKLLNKKDEILYKMFNAEVIAVTLEFSNGLKVTIPKRVFSEIIKEAKRKG